jgi:hypothetical protein
MVFRPSPVARLSKDHSRNYISFIANSQYRAGVSAGEMSGSSAATWPRPGAGHPARVRPDGRNRRRSCRGRGPGPRKREPAHRARFTK